jgi:hypothetical protein
VHKGPWALPVDPFGACRSEALAKCHEKPKCVILPMAEQEVAMRTQTAKTGRPRLQRRGVM